MLSPKNSLLITAAGIGKRMGTEIPKQFLLVSGKPVIVHTIEAFLGYDTDMEIVVTLPALHIDTWKEIAARYFDGRDIPIVAGGETRFHSVRNGLEMIGEDRLIGIHDAVRPLVSREVIARCYETAQKLGNAIPVIEVVESLRCIEGSRSYPVNRGDFRIVQTPQVFRGDIIKKAYKAEYRDTFTDDASVVEKMGLNINLVEGNRLNIKITGVSDIEMVGNYL